MPFEKADSGVVAWRSPTLEDVKGNESEITKAAANDLNVNFVKQEAAPPAPPDIRMSFKGPNEAVLSSVKKLLKGIQPVDIILPIYNSIHIARKCIDTVLTRTEYPFRLIIVNDASDKFTKDWLDAQDFPSNVEVLHNNKNRGFAATVNRGMRHTKNPYVCLLNSDVLVTKDWLTKMILALESNSKNVIVNPVTNNTALINVDMQQGCDYFSMNQAFEMTSQHRYPEVMPTGFLFLFRRALIDKIGYFDEGFKNFGEESDFWMKAITHLDNGYYVKYRAVLDDSTYVYHQRGASFNNLGQVQHMDLRKAAAERFHKIWPQYKMWSATHPADKVMGHYRQHLPRKAVFKMETDYRICWVVRATANAGGMKYIADIVNEINERGGDAKVVLVNREPNTRVTILPELRSSPVVFQGDEDFLEHFGRKVFKKGVVVSAISELAHLVNKLCESNPMLRGLNHVQSYDPMIAPDEKTKQKSFLSYNVLPDTITNSKWITDTLKETHKVIPLATVHPGIDPYLFYNRGRERGDDRLTVLMSLNKTYGFKGYNRGVVLAKCLVDLARTNNKEIRIVAYGVDNVQECPEIIGLGELTQERLATYLGTEVDLFIDPANYHSYGLPALEAMASGVAVAVWDNVGIGEYGEDEKNCRIFSKKLLPEKAALEVYKLLIDPDSRQKLAKGGYEVVKKHDRDKSVDLFIEKMELGLDLSFPKRRIVFVSPHLRKHGGPTTIINAANELSRRGHDVSISCVHTDVNPEVTVMSRVPISLDINNIPPCDVMVINSDNENSEFFSTLPQAKKKILFKMSHNARFKALEEQGLTAKWDAVVTTTNWLAEVCEKPLEKWNHPPVKATRIGWWHYAHGQFNCPTEQRKYGTATSSFIITTLIHAHPLKGTKQALQVLDRLRRKYPLEVIGVGEIPPPGIKLPRWVQYQYSPNRDRMSEIMKQTDLWLGASHTEGLGRMALEAMSASAFCVLSDTGAEYAQHEENCLLYPIGDLKAMEEAIEKVLKDRDLFMKVVKKGHTTASRYSSSADFIDNIDKVIYEICNGSK